MITPSWYGISYQEGEKAMNPVRSARRSARLGVRQCAELAGVSHPRIAEYENGDHSPSIERLQAVARAAGLRFAPVPGTSATVAEAADFIFQLERSGAPLRRLLRAVFQLNDDLTAAQVHVLGALVAAPAPLTGDARLDALIAGLVEWHTTRNNLPTPPWVFEPDRTLRGAWTVDTCTDEVDYVDVIARHGVNIGSAELVSV